MKTFQLRILEADSVFFSGRCESLIVPSIDGQYGVLANHSNMIGAVVPGILHYRAEGKAERIASVSGGMFKVEEDEVLVLVDSAEHPEEIDEHRARRAEAAAKEEMLQKKSMQEYRMAEAHLGRAISRLRVKNNYNQSLK